MMYTTEIQHIIISSVCILLISLVGAILARPLSSSTWSGVIQLCCLSFAAGATVTDAFAHLLPHAYHDTQFDDHNKGVLLGLCVVGGAVNLHFNEAMIYTFCYYLGFENIKLSCCKTVSFTLLFLVLFYYF
eukprot:GHVR01007816.1.p1 GENE.GHVR01007816.1~~GHVR01007816.1.p1  ORF type:complete len:131 (+),score=20.16 GHVR01007816.1:56-448(+)